MKIIIVHNTKYKKAILFNINIVTKTPMSDNNCPNTCIKSLNNVAKLLVSLDILWINNPELFLSIHSFFIVNISSLNEDCKPVNRFLYIFW